MKHILIIEVPDTIPDPEFSVIARCKDTFDGFEAVEHTEVIPPTEEEKREYINLIYNTPGYEGGYENSLLGQGINWTLKRLGL